MVWCSRILFLKALVIQRQVDGAGLFDHRLWILRHAEQGHKGGRTLNYVNSLCRPKASRAANFVHRAAHRPGWTHSRCGMRCGPRLLARTSRSFGRGAIFYLPVPPQMQNPHLPALPEMLAGTSRSFGRGDIFYLSVPPYAGSPPSRLPRCRNDKTAETQKPLK